MIKVGIVMGSDSDLPVMEKTAQTLKKLGIDYEMRSSLRTGSRTFSSTMLKALRKEA